MLCFNFLLFLIFFPNRVLLLGVKKKRCSVRSDCKVYEICGNDGVCIEGESHHCYGDEDCNVFGTGKCIFSSTDQVVGECEFSSLRFTILPDRMLLVEEMDDDIYRSIPLRRDLAKNKKCDSHFEEHYHHRHRTRLARNRRTILSNDCAMNVYCGDPSFRNQYNDKKMYSINMDWLVVKSDNWWKEANDRISEMEKQLGEVYNNAGFYFKSTISYYGLDSIAESIGLDDSSILEGFIVDKFDCGSGTELGGGFIQSEKGVVCISSEALMILLRGEDWNKLGAFQVLTVDFANERRLGFGKFPWARLHGMMAFSKDVIRKGQTTIPHELGHTFGLMHVFRGYDEHTCGSCVETEASDVLGDMISDTFPSPIHWECHYKDLEGKNDPCHTNLDGWKDAPLGNVMNYGTCRYLLTQQQMARMKCFNDVAFQNSYTTYVGKSQMSFQTVLFVDDDDRKGGRGFSRRSF